MLHGSGLSFQTRPRREPLNLAFIQRFRAHTSAKSKTSLKHHFCSVLQQLSASLFLQHLSARRGRNAQHYSQQKNPLAKLISGTKTSMSNASQSCLKIAILSVFPFKAHRCRHKFHRIIRLQPRGLIAMRA